MPIRITGPARDALAAVLRGAAVAAGVVALATAAATLPGSPVEGVYAGVSIGAAAALLAGAWAAGVLRLGAPRAQGVRVHRLLGLLASVPLCVVAATGVVLLLRPVLEDRIDPPRHLAPRTGVAPPSAWLAAAADAIDLDRAARVTLTWPAGEGRPARVRAETPVGLREAFVDPATAEVVPTRSIPGIDRVRALHVKLLLGPLGYGIAGGAALAGAWLGVTGLRIGRGLLRDALRIRVRAGAPRLWLDLHQRLGTWAWPGLALFSVTGATLALFGALAAGPLRVRFGGEAAAFWAARGPVDAPEASTHAAWAHVTRSTPDAQEATLDRIVAAAPRVWPDARLRSVQIDRPGTPDATATVRMASPARWPAGADELARFSLADGALLGVRRAHSIGVFERTEQVITALHTAEHAPAFVRALYGALGLAVAGLPASGLALLAARRWGAKRGAGGRRP